jgi:hypothetical protein
MFEGVTRCCIGAVVREVEQLLFVGLPQAPEA